MGVVVPMQLDDVLKALAPDGDSPVDARAFHERLHAWASQGRPNGAEEVVDALVRRGATHEEAIRKVLWTRDLGRPTGPTHAPEARHFGPGTDPFRVVRSRLATWEPGGRDGIDPTPVQWLVRAWDALPAEEAQRLAAAVATLVQDHEPRVRSGAIRFFQAVPTASDDGALLAAYRRAMHLFDHVVDPWPGRLGGNLRDLLTWVVALREHPPGPEALAMMRREVHRPTSGVLSLLYKGDPHYVELHLVDLLRKVPDTLEVVLHRALRSDRPVEPLLRRVAGDVSQEEVLAILERTVPEGPARDAGLSAIAAVYAELSSAA